MVKIQECQGRFNVTIPKNLIKLKGWGKGTKIEFREHDGKICLYEVQQ